MSEAIFVEGLTKAYLGVRTGGILLALCVMLGVAVLCTVLAVRFFRWE